MPPLPELPNHHDHGARASDSSSEPHTTAGIHLEGVPHERPGNNHGHDSSTSISNRTSPGISLSQITSAAREVLSEYVSAVKCIPPQVIVNCRGDRHAYSREFLKSGGYNGAINTFISRFAKEGDYTPTSFFRIPYSASPVAHVYASFYPRCHHENSQRANDLGEMQGYVSISKEGWSTLMDNVEMLEVVLVKWIR